MFLRTFSLAILTLPLVACGEDVTPEPEGPSVECAIGPGAELTDTCAFERVTQDTFVIHRPDGGFRKFSQGPGQEGFLISVADGAEPILSQKIDSGAGIIEFALAEESYRLPSELILPGSGQTVRGE